ncbi:MAG: addiction module protein [Methylacidiphilales bacterium]|nr:addiction module protein [Candidatus Methylacidiphilales bacterium]
MASSVEFRSLPLAEKLQLVEDIWDSIAEDQKALPDSSAAVKEVRERKARYLANPGSGMTWEDAKKEIRSGRA